MVLAECLLNLMSFYDKNDKIGQKTTFVCLLICLRYCCPSAFSVCISVLICLPCIHFLCLPLCYLSVLSSTLLVLSPSFPAALLSKLLEVELIYLTAAQSAVSSVCSGVFLQPATISYCFSASVTRGAERFLFLVHNHVVS